MWKNILLSSAVILSLGAVGEAWAACNNGDYSCNGKSGASAYCCYHVVSTNTDGKKNIEIYKDPAAPSDAVASVGEKAFWKNTTLASVSIGKGVTTIGVGAFYSTSINEISMPYIEYIEDLGLATASLSSVDIPSAKNIAHRGLGSNGIKHLNYIGLPATATAPINTGSGQTSKSCIIKENGYKICGTCDGYVKSGTGCVEDCGNGYYVDDDEKMCCQNGFVIYKSECMAEYPFAKKRYTPAEAAQWLNEDNNTITLTFKK